MNTVGNVEVLAFDFSLSISGNMSERQILFRYSHVLGFPGYVGNFGALLDFLTEQSPLHEGKEGIVFHRDIVYAKEPDLWGPYFTILTALLEDDLREISGTDVVLCFDRGTVEIPDKFSRRLGF